MEREKTQSKQQRKEIPTEQGPYSFFQSQVQGPAGLGPAEHEQPVLCSWLQRTMWTPNAEPTLPVPTGQGAFSPPPQRLSISLLTIVPKDLAQRWAAEREQSEMFQV